jgi:hypothetical protein
MPKPNKNFNGKALLSYNCCFGDGKYTQKDLDEVDFFDYCDYNDIIKNGGKVEAFHKLKGTYEEVKLVECEISSSQLNIDDNLYTYIEKDDVFMSLNYNTINEFVKIHAIYDTCASCGEKNTFVIPYCFNEKWICNNCINGDIEYHNNEGYGMRNM